MSDVTSGVLKGKGLLTLKFIFHCDLHVLYEITALITSVCCPNYVDTYQI